MPSEQRLHWASLFFDLARHVKQFAVPAVLVMIGASQSTGGDGGRFSRLPSGWEVWLLILFVPAVLASIVKYLTFRLRYDDRELVIRSGLVFRRERNIPFSRIQNVDASQNVFHRMFGVAEVRVETGGGKEEEAKLSVLPHAAFLEMRDHVFGRNSESLDDRRGESLDAPAVQRDTLVHLDLRELLLCGFLENKGMVLIGTAIGVGFETGVLNRISGQFADRLFFRSLFRQLFDGPFQVERLAIAAAVVAGFLIVARIVSMMWAFARLYDFRLTRAGEDLRSEYGLFTKVAATVPVRRVQAITINAGPLHRWLERSSVRVATAGGAGGGGAKDRSREWLAPLIRQQALPHLLHQVLPGFDLSAVAWQPVHPRAFARAVKPTLAFVVIVSLAASLLIGWGALGVFLAMLLWAVISTRQRVKHLGWAEDDEVVMMRSGWLWQQITLARVNKIQAVAMHQTPFDRRAAMSRVRVDTAGAGEFSHRVDIPYLDDQIARGLVQRLSVSAANTTFRW